MKVFCSECMEQMEKVKIKVGEQVNVYHFECTPCGTHTRVED